MNLRGPSVGNIFLQHKRFQQRSRGHDATTAEAAPGAVEVGEHDEGVSDREVNLIAI